MGGIKRFGEISKILPVAAVMAVIVVLYTEYVCFHCLRLMQLDLPEDARSVDEVNRGTYQLVIFHFITGLMLYCLARSILTSPGTIPDGKGWELEPERDDPSAQGRNAKSVDLLERKQSSGERRNCKWCLKYKPDRCHHCRVCNLCVLKMDHHCPWVYNCIGFCNHKYFFLLLVYAAVNLIFINFTMFESVWWSTRTDVSVAVMVALTCGASLAASLLVLTISFLGFHTWLMVKAMTTLEFCEKSLKKASYSSSVYNEGLYHNICVVLGPKPLLWFLPMSLPEGDGLTWNQGHPTDNPEGTNDPSVPLASTTTRKSGLMYDG